MRKLTYKKLDGKNLQHAIKGINEVTEGSEWHTATATILVADIPFLKHEGKIYEVTGEESQHGRRAFYILYQDRFFLIDFTGRTIEKFKADKALVLNSKTVIHYVDYFFRFVRGKHGRFLLLENTEDVPWSEPPSPSAQKALGDMINAPRLIKEDDVKFVISTSLLFKKCLFEATVNVEKATGNVTMSDEKLLVEEMPVLDDVHGL